MRHLDPDSFMLIRQIFKKISFCLFIFIIFSVLITPGPVLAQDNNLGIDYQIKNVKFFAAGLGLPVDKSASDILVAIINVLLSFAALLALLVLIIGGLMYILSVGDDQKTARAKKIIIVAIAGLMIIGAAAIIVYMIGRIFGVVGAP